MKVGLIKLQEHSGPPRQNRSYPVQRIVAYALDSRVAEGSVDHGERATGPLHAIAGRMQFWP